MDFFSHQTQARQKTSQLVVLFALAVVSLIVILNLFIAALFIGGGEGGTRNLLHFVTFKQWFYVSAVVLVGVGGASFIRWLQLREGGKVVALSLGGRLIHPDTQDFYEKRVLNIVEEIALAAGVPVPPVYLLPENDINAFAAGYKLSDAVIGVTQGCVTKLSRDQLQGVIAHEFSHIFNGDMRLNIRLMALLFGILFIGLTGRFLLEITARAGASSSRSKRDNSGALVVLLLAVGLIVIGYCGVFFGNLIKAAVSRQREFLADASAVQFTRNPEGIAGALKVIAVEGSLIQHPKSAEASHLFFGKSQRYQFFSLFATHPPLEQRIRRIEPRWDGQYLAAQTKPAAEAELKAVQEKQFSSNQIANLAVGAALADSTPVVPLWQSIFNELDGKARHIHSAPFLVMALLLSKDAHAAKAQRQCLAKSWGENDLTLLDELVKKVAEIPDEQRLPLVELAIPTLKNWPQKTAQGFCNDLKVLRQQEAQPTVFSWCLTQLVEFYLTANFMPASKGQERFHAEREILVATGVVLSALARFGQDNSAEIEKAFQAGVQAGGFGELSLRQLAGFNELETALARLRRAYPHIKGRLAKSMLATIQYDGILKTDELNLVRTISALLEMPTVLSAA